ncbi:Yip1 family protein [Variovorax sp. RB3P1]|uniref:Yip1 family protein n=1 Tax=Variovorax sp. RB3P1 TaxID=3443732 RepID=UPI003F48ADBE
MNLVDRVQSILLRPKITWLAIEEEPADAASLYRNYVMILALIPAVASFIGLSLVGIGAFGVSFRVPIVAGLANMVVGYVMSLVMVFVLALIIDAMAPTFEGTKSQIGALKLSAYASTAAFVGGIFSLLPSLSVVGALAALYGVYLLYTGLPVLMKCPQDKAIAYTAVVVVCAIVGGFVIAWVLSLLTPSPVRLGALPAVDAVVAMQQLAPAVT